MQLTQQRIIIIGGTSGIGLATAHALVMEGADVVIASRQKEKVDNAVAQIGRNVTGEVVDATSKENLHSFFQRIGPFDHLVLTLSGGEGSGAFRTLDMAALRRGFEAKFWGQVLAAQASLDTLKSNSSITFVTAISARSSRPGIVGLAAINGALEAMVKPLAMELRPLRVNAVSPGVIATPWWDRLPEEQRNAVFAQSASDNPVGRVGQPEDVAQAITFLIGNSFMTGSVIECDGGLRL